MMRHQPSFMHPSRIADHVYSRVAASSCCSLGRECPTRRVMGRSCRHWHSQVTSCLHSMIRLLADLVRQKTCLPRIGESVNPNFRRGKPSIEHGHRQARLCKAVFGGDGFARLLLMNLRNRTYNRTTCSSLLATRGNFFNRYDESLTEETCRQF
jgi:hypothetical protein